MSINAPILRNSAIRARSDATAALTAAHRSHRHTIRVNILTNNKFTEVEHRAQIGVDKQRITTYPAQSCAHGKALFGKGCGVGKGTEGHIGGILLESRGKGGKHLLNRYMIVTREGVRCHLCAPPLGVAIAQRRTIRHATHHDTSCPLDKESSIEALVDIAFEVGERRVVTRSEPAAEPIVLSGHSLGTNNAYEVKTDLVSSVNYKILRYH